MELNYMYTRTSESGHCCFEFTVVNVTKPLIMNGERQKNRFETVCECFEEDEAIRITEALNLAEGYETAGKDLVLDAKQGNSWLRGLYEGMK